ncbi:hypothetical protein PM10SUCC1_33060 [Propionigenium maris DSM 9537]|uniref:Uncharacterized protein n=1 Tax=Propionigenium maris DSM 9537 TaxID=1123000 RepID=A0A9W6GPY3_9FUSO|nr:hypothetical protein [Propionigenium maris]GLI57792.1 hypothetical protein PM10SUCC1_33060 [Propionigenium maris DSM 9537]
MLKNIDRSILWDYVKDTITDQEKEEMGETIYSADSDTLWEALELKLEQEQKEVAIFVGSRVKSSEILKRIDDEEILSYIKDQSQYYIAESVEELMEQIKVSGCMDEVTELFEMKYTG